MLTSILIFAIAYIFIASERIDKTIAALVGAGAAVFFHTIGYEEALHAIDLNVIFLLVGMMIVVNTLSDTGAFEWLAIRLARLAKGNGLVITVLFMFLTAVLSALLDNVTTVILIAPITILITQILEMPAVPILIMEAVFSNIGGTATLVGDPPNILIGSQTSLSFNDFLLNLSPIVFVMMVVLVGVMALLLKNKLKTTEKLRARIDRSRPERAVVQPQMLKKALVVFSFIMAGFFCGRLLEIEPGIIALTGAMIMVLVCKQDLHHSLAKVEWNTILFFVGLFMMIAAMEHHHVFEKLGEHILAICKGNLMLTAFAILWVSAIGSAIVDNIPLVMAMIPLVKGIIPVFSASMGIEDAGLIHTQIAEPLLWSLALGACLGGNGTLVGASANVVIAQIAKRNNCPISFMEFTKYGFPFMIASLGMANIYIWLRYFA